MNTLKNTKYILILILLFIISPAKSQEVEIKTDKIKRHKPSICLPFSHHLIVYESERAELSKIDKLMDLLKIRPGMTILDIGTGTGQYAYKFAEKLKGTGKVFATDIEIDKINYVTEEAHKRSLVNLYPVLVKQEGIDEFYSKHQYDLIFLSYVPFPINYFKKMRSFLAQEGRLVIISYKSFSTPDFFSLDEFVNFEGLIKELSQEPVDTPFYKGLRESTRELIKQKTEDNPNELLKKAIVDDFNEMLSDRHFCSNFLTDELIFKKDIPFSSEERDYANWLIHSLKSYRSFDKASEDFERVERRNYTWIRKLNRLFIIQRFKQYLYKGGASSYGYSKTRSLRLLKELEKAGYKLENKYDDLIFFSTILVFRANRDAEEE